MLEMFVLRNKFSVTQFVIDLDSNNMPIYGSLSDAHAWSYEVAVKVLALCQKRDDLIIQRVAYDGFFTELMRDRVEQLLLDI